MPTSRGSADGAAVLYVLRGFLFIFGFVLICPSNASSGCFSGDSVQDGDTIWFEGNSEKTQSVYVEKLAERRIRRTETVNHTVVQEYRDGIWLEKSDSSRMSLTIRYDSDLSDFDPSAVGSRLETAFAVFRDGGFLQHGTATADVVGYYTLDIANCRYQVTEVRFAANFSSAATMNRVVLYSPDFSLPLAEFKADEEWNFLDGFMPKTLGLIK